MPLSITANYDDALAHHARDGDHGPLHHPDPGVPAGCDPVRPTSGRAHAARRPRRRSRPVPGRPAAPSCWAAARRSTSPGSRSRGHVAVRQGAVVRWASGTKRCTTSRRDGPAGFSSPTSATAAPTSSGLTKPASTGSRCLIARGDDGLDDHRPAGAPMRRAVLLAAIAFAVAGPAEPPTTPARGARRSAGAPARQRR